MYHEYLDPNMPTAISFQDPEVTANLINPARILEYYSREEKTRRTKYEQPRILQTAEE
jgi:hypothetical protein